MKSWNSKNIIAYIILLGLNLMLGLLAIGLREDSIWAHAYTTVAQVAFVFVMIYPLFVFQSLSPKQGIAHDVPQLITFIPQTIKSLFLKELKIWPILMMSCLIMNLLLSFIISQLNIDYEVMGSIQTMLRIMGGGLVVTAQAIAMMTYSYSKQVAGLNVFIIVMIVNVLIMFSSYFVCKVTGDAYQYINLALLVFSIGFFMSQFKRMELIHQ